MRRCRLLYRYDYRTCRRRRLLQSARLSAKLKRKKRKPKRRRSGKKSRIPLQTPVQTVKVKISQIKRVIRLVLRLAGEHGIQLEEVEGTGAGGRITRKDIQKIIDSGMKQKLEAPAPAAVQTTQQAPKQQQNKHRHQLCQPVILKFRLQASEKPSPPICIKAKQKFRMPGR